MKITEYLDANHVKYQLRSHRPAFTAQRLAAEEHISGTNVAKPVIVQTDGKYYMCVLQACCKVDLESLRISLGAGDVQLASEEEMANLFPNCQLGAEPPFGNIFHLPTLIDKHLADGEYVLFQAGKHDQAIQIEMKDYRDLVHPKILDFSYHLH